MVGFSMALFVIVMLEVWAGRSREFWLHVPIGVSILVWMRGRMGGSPVGRWDGTRDGPAEASH